jgi:hypothetical protein
VVHGVDVGIVHALGLPALRGRYFSIMHEWCVCQ